MPLAVGERVHSLTRAQARLGGWALLLIFVGLRWAHLGSAGAFPDAGGPNVNAAHTPAGLRVGPTGYDGQFVYRLALDPFTRVVTAHGITLDLPGYRQQRIMTALLAHLLALVPGLTTFTALITVNVVAVGVAIWFGTALAELVGRHPGLGLVLAVPACMPISVGRDLTEPVAWAGALAGIYLVRRRQWLGAAVALAISILARETTAVVTAGLILGELWTFARHRPEANPRAAWLALPVVVAAAWQLWLSHVWGTLPLRTGETSQQIVVPVISVVGSFLWGLVGQHSSSDALGLVFLVERLVLLALLATSAWVVFARRSEATLGEGLGWVFACVLALSLGSWRTDVAFLRATYEAWAMSVLMLVLARPGWRRYPLYGSGVITLGVAVMYVRLT